MGMIAKLEAELQSSTNDATERVKKVLGELNLQSENLRPAKLLLCHLSGMKSLHSEDRLINGIDSRKNLATVVVFFEANISIGKDFQKAARYLNAAPKARNWNAYYYLRMIYPSGFGVPRPNIMAIEYFEKKTCSKHPKSMAKL